MKFKLMVLAGAATVLVSACGFTPKEQAEGDFDYTQLQTDKKIQPAPGKQLPASTNRYAIPEAKQTAPLGKDVSVIAPTLVWPVANGSRVEESETKVRVYFDELEGMSDVEQYVWLGVTQALDTRGMGITEEQSKQRIVTDWLTQTVTFGEDEQELTLRRKVAIAMDTADHGRTTALQSEVVAREFSNGQGSNIDDQLLEHLDRDAAASVLNTIISEIALTQQTGVASVEDDGSVAITTGFDEDGYAAILVSASFSFTWAIMGEVLPELGFAIDDFNQQTGRYYTEYDMESSGFSALAFWRDNKAGMVELPSGEYELKVTGDRSRTSLTFFYQGQPLSAAEVTRIFAPVAAEIRKQSTL